MKKKLNEEHQALLGPADLYEREKVPSMFRPLANFFLEHVPLKDDDRVLDLACGTGILARIVAPKLGPEGRVTGVDISPEMLRVAGENTPAEVSITWREGSADELPFEDESFDLVLCQQGFQFFPDKPQALKEVHRVLAPGGRVAMIMACAVSPQNQPYQWAKVEAFREHVSLEAGEKHRNLVPFFDGDSEKLHSLLSGAEFREVEVLDKVHIRYRGFPEEFVTEEDYAELAPDVRAAVVNDIREAMARFVDEEGTAVPYGFFIAQAVK